MFIFSSEPDGADAENLYPFEHMGRQPDREAIQAWFDRAKEDPEGIRAWNGKFDRSFAVTAGFDVPGDGKWHDGMICSHPAHEPEALRGAQGAG
jgi:hypothetical protein